MIRDKAPRFVMEWVLLLGMLLILGGTIAYWLYQELNQIRTAERDRLQVQARVVADNLGRQLQGVNNALAGTRDEMALWGSKIDARERALRLKLLADAMPGVRAIGVFDAGGTAVSSSRKELIGNTVARERGFFKVPRARPDRDVLYVSPPFKSTLLGLYSITLARAVIGPTGKFAGIVVATLEPEYFAVLLRSVLYAPDMLTGVVHGDGEAFLYVPPNAQALGRNLAVPESNFSRHQASGQMTSVFTGRVYSTDEIRVMVLRTVNPADLHMDKPLIIGVSRRLSDINAPWHTQALTYGAAYGLFALMAILSLYVAQRRRRAFDRVAVRHAADQQDSAERLRLATGAAGLGVFEYDLVTGRLTWDDAMFTLHGVNPAAFSSRIEDWKDRVLPEDLPAAEAALQTAANEGRQAAMQYRVRHGDGQVRVIGTVAQLRRDASGRPAKVFGVSEDITERKQVEARHSQLESQLRESQKMEAIGTLAGGIAHDFNNVLAIILGNAELARQDMSASPVALESLQEIHKAASRALGLVQQILSFSRRHPPEREPTALAPIVEESVRLLRATLPARVVLDLRCDTDVPVVLANTTQMQQVLINIANNAMQAMGGRSGHIGIRLDTVMLDAAMAEAHPVLAAMHRRHQGPAVRLTVSDDGPGMDATTLRRIFEPFFTTKEVNEGTGLGLSVVHGIVQAHEGEIEVDSAPGKGATFTLYLPAANPEPGGAQHDRDRSPAATEPAPGAQGGQHILYIDDDESLVLLVRRLLERRGYRVSGYTDQCAALDALRAGPQRFDLVVTDYNMPGMSGLELAREVRAIRADLPVAIASGFIDEELQKQASECGVRELIFKADAAEDLCEALARLAQTVGASSNSF